MEAGTSSAVIVSELLDRVWNDGDVDAAARCIADGYTIHHDPGDPWEGQQLSVGQYAERVSACRGFLPDVRFTVHELLADDDKVILTWRGQGTIAVDQAGFPPSGTVQTASGATVYYIDGGKITGPWQIIHRTEPSTPDSAERGPHDHA